MKINVFFKRIKLLCFFFLLFFVVFFLPLKSNEYTNQTERNYWIGASLMPLTNPEMSYCYFLTYNFENILLSINYFDMTQDNSEKCLNFRYDNLYTSEYFALIGVVFGEKTAKLSIETGIGYFSRKRVSYINNNSFNTKLITRVVK